MRLGMKDRELALMWSQVVFQALGSNQGSSENSGVDFRAAFARRQATGDHLRIVLKDEQRIAFERFLAQPALGLDALSWGPSRTRAPRPGGPCVRPNCTHRPESRDFRRHLPPRPSEAMPCGPARYLCARAPASRWGPSTISRLAGCQERLPVVGVVGRVGPFVRERTGLGQIDALADVAGIGEGRRDLACCGVSDARRIAGGPTDMVAVVVGHEHEIDCFRRKAGPPDLADQTLVALAKADKAALLARLACHPGRHPPGSSRHLTRSASSVSRTAPGSSRWARTTRSHMMRGTRPKKPPPSI